MNNADKPAYPLHLDIARQAISKSDGYMPNGLTKRERFAMAAMQGLLANSEEANAEFDFLASNAVYAADALLNKLEEKE